MKRWALVLGPLLAVAVAGCTVMGNSSTAVTWTVAMTVLCASWWIFEPIPISITALIPLFVFPCVGVLTPLAVGQVMTNKVILLLLGGFILSAGMERSGAHRRLALRMVTVFGSASGRRLVFGFMAAAGLLSMWISNAAATLMLLPIALAVVENTTNSRLRTSLLLGIAYAASLGGITTPIGTPPNLVFLQVFEANTGMEPSFLNWMMWSLPVVVIMAPLTGIWLTRKLDQHEPILLPPVGRWNPAETRMMIVFVLTAILWVTRREPWGGWSQWINLPQANDAAVALTAVAIMFLIPNGTNGKLMDLKTAIKIPWGILILFCGGIAIAKAFVSTGLSEILGNTLGQLGTFPPILLIGMVCLVVTFLTEVTSNTATTTLLLPILASAALAADVDPKILMVPATISASFAFMLPVATAPNAIVFGTQELTVRTMAREGLLLNLVGAIVVTAVCYLWFG
ncbi:MAG: SLC13 family permease [Pirellulaceae bacterium]|nr:SLC13 family permease [Pirellulaceae bacterium]